jgi:hypothetical protein
VSFGSWPTRARVFSCTNERWRYTAQRPSLKLELEAAAFDDAVETIVGGGKNVLLKNLFNSVGNGAKYPRRKVEMPTGGDEDGRMVSYIVGRSIANAKSLTGRATRCFVAMSMETGKLVFLKDSWRLDVEGMKGEAHWFGRLREAKIEHLRVFTRLRRQMCGSEARRSGNIRPSHKSVPPHPDKLVFERFRRTSEDDDGIHSLPNGSV